MLDSVTVPEELQPAFEKAQEFVRAYFADRRERPSEGTIEVAGERYILVRAASMSVEFFELILNLYRDKPREEALSVARSLLFDVAHAIGVADAREFHKRMGVTDPIERLSAGPIHFSFSGWAYVDILPESSPTPDDDFFILYDHPYSFESDSWIRVDKHTDFPVCVMNSGYSSGWTEASFEMPLVASEILCKAKGDDRCRFLMAPPARIEDRIREYLQREPDIGARVTRYEIPGFFKRKRLEEELLRARKLESIGVLAGGIAHDFNNILTSIHGSVSLARKHSPVTSEVGYILERAERACRRARDLTQQLLTFSKGGAPVREAASVVEIIRQSADFALSGANVRSTDDFAENLYPVNVDRGQISQVIQNLVLNASQSMPEGGTVSLRARNVEPGSDVLRGLALSPGPYVAIDVEDEGDGIPEQARDRIFDPYFTTREQGMGLGLATTYAIVRKHDGHIAMRSEEGQGSCFTVYLPASPDADLSDDPETPPELQGRGRILVMDDDEDIRELLQILLADLGYAAEVTADGEAAIAAWEAARAAGRPFDAVIMDLTIPGGMGGQETIQTLRERAPQIVAIVSSGYSNDPIMARYAEYGFAGVIAKPYSLEEIGRTLKEVLAKTG